MEKKVALMHDGKVIASGQSIYSSVQNFERCSMITLLLITESFKTKLVSFVKVYLSFASVTVT